MDEDVAGASGDVAVADVVRNFGLAKATPWAVLLCRFADETGSMLSREHCERLFTGVGSGSMNMVDFFGDVSHGKLDLGGSKVFGPFTLPRSKGDYVGNVANPPPGKLNRGGLFELCEKTANDNGVNLGQFSGVVVVMAGSVDLFGFLGGMGAVCDSGNAWPSALGQEMGHGYGLDHARKQGSSEEYADPWDIMSTQLAHSAPHSEYHSIGPGLNAAAMRSRAWLDEDRVWKPHGVAFDSIVELRPLHRRDLSGALAAEIGPNLVEFRLKERWDANIPHSCVLVHGFENNHSIVMRGIGSSFEFREGDVFASHHSESAARYECHVLEIDEGAKVARVRLVHQLVPSLSGILVQILQGLTGDGGGVIWYGGKLTKVPPWSPMLAVLQHMITYLGGGGVGGIAAAEVDSASQRAALTAIAREILTQLSELDPPPMPTEEPQVNGERGESPGEYESTD